MISSDPDKPCMEIWGYAATMHNYEGCVNPDGDEGGNWCATEVDDTGMYVSGSGKWGYCNEYCPHCFGGDNCCTETNCFRNWHDEFSVTFKKVLYMNVVVRPILLCIVHIQGAFVYSHGA